MGRDERQNMTNLSAEEQEYRSRCLAYNISNGTSLTVSEYLEMTIRQMKNDEKREFKKSNRTVGLDKALVNNIKRRL